MPLPLAFVLGPPLLKAAIGGAQTMFGLGKQQNLRRPVRTTAPSIAEGTARTRFMAQAGEAPGSQIAREQIGTQQAGAVSQISKAGGTSGTTMAAALGAQKQADVASRQQSIQDQRFKLGANMQYMQMLKQMAQEHQMNFQWNQAQKFQEDADAARRLTESGMQNLVGGLSEAGGTSFAYNQLMQEDPTQSKFWNQKMGYMGTAEQYEETQAFNIDKYQKTLAGPGAPPVSNPMHGQFEEGINTEGYMNPWMPPLSQLKALSQGPNVMGP